MQDNPLPFDYSIRRSKRAKNLLIHVELDGSVEVVLPRRVARREAERFVSERLRWIEQVRARNIEKHESIPRRRLATGERLPFFGDTIELVITHEPARKRVFVQEDGMRLTVIARDEAQVREKIVQWYRKRARDYFVGQAIEMAQQIGKRVRSVRVLNTKSQWGSCNRRAGKLTFQWRLALAPERIARYVVAHEVAHLQHANHSREFWAAVGELYPGYKEAKAWLRQYGYRLML